MLSDEAAGLAYRINLLKLEKFSQVNTLILQLFVQFE